MIENSIEFQYWSKHKNNYQLISIDQNIKINLSLVVWNQFQQLNHSHVDIHYNSTLACLKLIIQSTANFRMTEMFTT